MKENYEKLKMTIIYLEEEDVLTASGTTTDCSTGPTYEAFLDYFYGPGGPGYNMGHEWG